jgi:hypothetical protein
MEDYSSEEVDKMVDTMVLMKVLVENMKKPHKDTFERMDLNRKMSEIQLTKCLSILNKLIGYIISNDQVSFEKYFDKNGIKKHNYILSWTEYKYSEELADKARLVIQMRIKYVCVNDKDPKFIQDVGLKELEYIKEKYKM